MDSITQIALGAAVGEATLGHRVGKKAPLWGAALGTLPDLDVLANPFISEVTALLLHRGPTHSILFATLMAPLIGALLARWHRSDDASWRDWALLAFLALGTHIVLDSFTTYGTRVFWPFSDYPLILGSIFIIDPLYTVPLGVGVLVALLFAPTDRRRRWINYAGLGLSTAYLLLTGFNKLYVQSVFTEALQAQDLPATHTFVQPTALNNLLWSCTAEGPDAFWVGYYSLLDDDRQVRFRRVPKNRELLGSAHGDDPAVEILEWFSRGFFTVSRSSDGALLVHDLRFGRSDLGLTESGKYVFTFRLQANDDGQYTAFTQTQPQFDARSEVLRRFLARIRGIETTSPSG
jgi:inner membrane protein